MSETSAGMNVDFGAPDGTDLNDAGVAELQEHARRATRSCAWIPGKRHSNTPRVIFRSISRRFLKLEAGLYGLRSGEPSDDLKWLYDNLRLLRTEIRNLRDSAKSLATLPLVRAVEDEEIPRCLVLARALLKAANYRLSESAFSFFVTGVEEVEPLRLSELWGMIPALKMILLDSIAEQGIKALEAFRVEGLNAPSYEIGRQIDSLRLIGEIEWSEILERLSVVHRILCLDPAGVYPRMDAESRELYRRRIGRISAHSDLGEIDLARFAVSMAEMAKLDPAAPETLRERLRHVGYYLLDDVGSEELLNRVGYRPSFGGSVQRFFRKYPDELYIIGIEVVTLLTVVALIMRIVRTHGGSGLIVSALLLIIPATQAAVELMNYLVTTVLNPHALPKLDFSKAVEPACATMVAIPTLLINEKQIGQLVEDLEVRYLVNRDPNIFYVLLTDLPDTAEPPQGHDYRIDLAIQLINDLNAKHVGEPYGGFYLFHRHRVYNRREGTWMGWERKRGKLLDLNRLLRSASDPFPVKAGDMSRLPNIRYVLTLDSDTKLPRGAAQLLIGTMAHPLNWPMVDPELNIVTRGYGILQPRVGISVHSATRSRLASIYSGQTGFDIYSRAVSDVYQDLYGEGIFTGKGIYDVDAFRQVLEYRFPRNVLLSHDLIEGAYARAGLVSDIEVIDDYPTRYSAYNRRRHRWLRGDWQIARWIFNRVPDESRRLIANPISLASRWKILDNLRRSLIEPATFALLIAGWFFLPGGPGFWTLVTLCLLFLPIYFRLVFSLVRAAWNRNWISAREAFADFLTSHVSISLNIAFLAHQSLVSLDAIIRTIIRSTVTHSRLLEWETATEAELGIKKRTPVDVYLDWVPLFGLCLGLALLLKPSAALYALPFIIVWACSKLISIWLNRSPHSEAYKLSVTEHRLLRAVALRTWRYFAEFSNEKNNWLIPDNVQEEPYRVAERISPTNLGFLLNARQAALEFGYLTLPEFVYQTELTLASASRLPRQLGHFLNWYDNISLTPLDPPFLSSVDSGNLVASLWSLKQHCLELLQQPIVRQNALEGLSDYYRILSEMKIAGEHPAQFTGSRDLSAWLPRVVDLPADSNGNDWWSAELRTRIEALRQEARDFMPWFLPEFEQIRDKLPNTAPTPEDAGRYYKEISDSLQSLTIETSTSPEALTLAARLREELPACRDRLHQLASRLSDLASQCGHLANEMDFSALADARRKLLSVGYDVRSRQLNKSCYDLLASESRTAAFIAIAKGEVVQESWFRLGRQHTTCEGETVLISWTGTMFEYLMPVIWMKSHPDTLLDRAADAAVRVQQSYAARHNIPWGISEAAYNQRDQDGNYQYAAFGVPGLALNVARAGSLIVSPYSSCLGLLVDTGAAVRNLLRMTRKKWLSQYGFYESADFTGSRGRAFLAPKYNLVRCWMSHHQGMSLAAICNVLNDAPFQRWFHAEPLVQASELILQERPLRVRPIADSQPRRVLTFAREKPNDPAHASRS